MTEIKTGFMHKCGELAYIIRFPVSALCSYLVRYVTYLVHVRVECLTLRVWLFLVRIHVAKCVGSEDRDKSVYEIICCK